MAESAYISEVTAQTFDSLVLQKSNDIPVLVDFWAAWCGPCQMLMPLLAKITEDYAGKFHLAKVNTDNEKSLAEKYGIRSLPTVKLFQNGEPVDGFMGVQPEPAIRALLDRYIKRESDTAATEAQALVAAGKPTAAITLLTESIESDPENERIKLDLIRLLIENDQLDEAAKYYESLSPDTQSSHDAAALKTIMDFVDIIDNAKPQEELEAILASDPGNSAARHQLGAYKVLAKDYEAAAEEFLELIKTDRQHGEDAGRKSLLALFTLLDAHNDLVKRYRTKLSRLLN